SSSGLKVRKLEEPMIDHPFLSAECYPGARPVAFHQLGVHAVGGGRLVFERVVYCHSCGFWDEVPISDQSAQDTLEPLPVTLAVTSKCWVSAGVPKGEGFRPAQVVRHPNDQNIH